MVAALSAEKIREIAEVLDTAIEKHDVEKIVSCFSTECEIQLPGITLHGHEGLRKAIAWMYKRLHEITLVPVSIIIRDNIFFEEFVVRSDVAGKSVEVRQSEVLIYDRDYKISSIRLYFDRIEFGLAFSSNIWDSILLGMVNKVTLNRLR